MLKDGEVHHTRHKEEPEGSTDGAGEDKIKSTRFVGIKAEPVGKISIDGGKVIAVIQRQEDSSNDKIAQQVAKNHLHIGELLVRIAKVTHNARNRNERDA